MEMNHVLRSIGFYSACMALAVGWAAVTEPSRDSVTLDDHVPNKVHLQIEEDDPRWDCTIHGNLVCGDPEGQHRDAAWQSWDALGGWKYLKVDPNRSFKVDYVGTAQQQPRLGEAEAALPDGSGGYYVFRAQYDMP